MTNTEADSIANARAALLVRLYHLQELIMLCQHDLLRADFNDNDAYRRLYFQLDTVQQQIQIVQELLKEAESC